MSHKIQYCRNRGTIDNPFTHIRDSSQIPITNSLGEVYSIQHYVMKLASDLRQVGGFLLVSRFPPPIMTATL